MKIESAKDFLLSDFPKTLFPLETTKVLVEKCSNQLTEFIYGKVVSPNEKDYAFLPQTKTYASKPGLHLRRTLKLDPVADLFLHDLIFRNRTLFRKDFQNTRTNFGYRFEAGESISATIAFHEFRDAAKSLNAEYKFCLKFDIASYFNSIYHHDLINWASSFGFSEEDTAALDQFLKQINSGRSIDCLPQGLYPAKMIGSHFLKFVDNSARLKSERVLRFMDDFILFSNDQRAVISDFQTIQVMLGEKGLSVNSGKTYSGEIVQTEFEKEIDEVKQGLLSKRLELITGFSDDPDEPIDESVLLEEFEEEYLMALLSSKHLEEDDAELALKLMRDNSGRMIQYLENILLRFPNLAKSVYYFCSSLDDPEELGPILQHILSSDEQLTESQLFWMTRIAESYLSKTPEYGEILINCLEHPDSTQVSKSKVLEIGDKRFGLYEIRETNLRTGSSNWVSWASAVGMLTEKRANRNHLLSYFGNGSAINRLVKECLEKM